MGKWNSPNMSVAQVGFSVPRAFKLDHLQQIKPILFPKFSNFLHLYWGANSYYPREGRAENGKRESSNH